MASSRGALQWTLAWRLRSLPLLSSSPPPLVARVYVGPSRPSTATIDHSPSFHVTMLSPEASVPLASLERWYTGGASAPVNDDPLGSNVPEKRSPFPFDPVIAAKIVLWQGNLVRLEADAIVNSTNESLSDRSGLCGDIFRCAGPELAVEVAKLEGCRTGESKATKGYSLPARYVVAAVAAAAQSRTCSQNKHIRTYPHVRISLCVCVCSFVIHTVGPRYNVKYKTAAENALHSCYRSCLQVAVENELHSVGFCVVNSIKRGYPREDGAHIALRTSGKARTPALPHSARTHTAPPRQALFVASWTASAKASRLWSLRSRTSPTTTFTAACCASTFPAATKKRRRPLVCCLRISVRVSTRSSLSLSHLPTRLLVQQATKWVRPSSRSARSASELSHRLPRRRKSNDHHVRRSPPCSLLVARCSLLVARCSLLVARCVNYRSGKRSDDRGVRHSRFRHGHGG